MAILVHVQDPQNSAFSLAKHLPRNNVGMVLGLGNDDLVALIDECLSERECHKVDGSCGSGSENYLFASGGVNIFLDSIACAFIFICGIDGEFMDRAMDVGVRANGQLSPFVDHRLRPLGGRSVVKIDQLLAIDSARKRRKHIPKFSNIHCQTSIQSCKYNQKHWKNGCLLKWCVNIPYLAQKC